MLNIVAQAYIQDKWWVQAFMYMWRCTLQSLTHYQRYVFSLFDSLASLHSTMEYQSGYIAVFHIQGREGAWQTEFSLNSLQVPFASFIITLTKQFLATFPHHCITAGLNKTLILQACLALMI